MRRPGKRFVVAHWILPIRRHMNDMFHALRKQMCAENLVRLTLLGLGCNDDASTPHHGRKQQYQPATSASLEMRDHEHRSLAVILVANHTASINMSTMQATGVPVCTVLLERLRFSYAGISQA